MNVYAQSLKIGDTEINGPLDSSISDIGSLISTILNFVFPFAAFILLIMLIWGGYTFMMSKGEPEQVMNAKAKITTSIIGFILLIALFVIMQYIIPAILPGTSLRII